MDVRYSANARDVKRYTTQEMRDEFLVQGLYKPDEVTAVYSHVDRMVVVGIMPVSQTLPIDKGIDIMANFGTNFFLERREAGFFNLGGSGVCTVDGTAYKMGLRDCIYITKGCKEVTFASDSKDNPARFYGVSSPAHKACETKLLTMAQAAKNPVGAAETANKRVINQFIHPAVLETCQLMMGLTVLDSGSVWNTMPAHTHERRMEIYTYFDIPEEQAVFHMMGAPTETRHIIVQNYDAVISPSWSIHAGCGTSNYAFIWAMGGENQTFTDMDTIPTSQLR
ncbi:MAG: 5-dehydro-4-deoxy-D-glucuronate isomerase [Defluviitaleaceae bacterium]|nr:5-dehydro-4-deoxy-D-glucuronate isomerase [Defluviitaleaceae bacterium]